MKRIIFSILFLIVGFIATSQVVSMRVVETAYSNVDPDGAGPAIGVVTFQFELMSTIPVMADGIGMSAVIQSARLMATPTNTTTALGPLAAGVGWAQGVDNRAGIAITPVTYGGQTFDTRMIVTFNQSQGLPNIQIDGTWRAVCQITYWAKSLTLPEGGYAVNEPNSIVAQNELSSDGGLSTYPIESPNLALPTPLGTVVPVQFTKFDAKCSGNGALITWATAQESNSSRFEIERSINGRDWSTVGTVAAAGNSSTDRNYQQIDLNGGTAFYRIKQIDKDGRFIYTAVERTNCQFSDISSVLFPVPAQDVLNVVIKSDRSVKTQLLVYDAAGKLVRKVNAPITSGNNNFSISLVGLPAGDYSIRTTDDVIKLNKLFTIAR